MSAPNRFRTRRDGSLNVARAGNRGIEGAGLGTVLSNRARRGCALGPFYLSHSLCFLP